jgi:hypothetical protein
VFAGRLRISCLKTATYLPGCRRKTSHEHGRFIRRSSVSSPLKNGPAACVTGAEDSVMFDNGVGATLSPVTGGSPSAILGRLSATRSLYVINGRFERQYIAIGSIVYHAAITPRCSQKRPHKRIELSALLISSLIGRRYGWLPCHFAKKRRSRELDRQCLSADF